MATKSVENGDFYNRIGAVALLTAQVESDGALQGRLESFEKASIYNGLNFRFRFKYYCDEKQALKGEGSVGILGLNRDTIRAWASAIAPEEYRRKKHFVRVYAGYQSDGDLAQCELFTAWITGGTPTSPPDMWLNLDIQNGSAALSNLVVSSQGSFCAGMFTLGTAPRRRGEATQGYWNSGGMTVRRACESLVATLNGKPLPEDYQTGNNDAGHIKQDSAAEFSDNNETPFFLEWRISDDLEVRMPHLRAVDFSSMKLAQAVATINSWGVVQARTEVRFVPVSGGTQFMEESGLGDFLTGGNYGNGVLRLNGNLVRVRTALIVEPNFANWDYRTNQKPPFRIDQNSGMIGIPKFGMTDNLNTVNVKCLMRRDIGIGDLIEPVSQFMESPRKYYRVTAITYEGEFRGQSWYVTYEAQGEKEQDNPSVQRMINAARAKARADRQAASTAQQVIGSSTTGYVMSAPVSTATSEDLQEAEEKAEKKLRAVLRYGKDI